MLANSRYRSSMRAIHPGEVLREEFLVPLGLSARRLAVALGVPTSRVSSLVAERGRLTADTALRLSRVLGTTPEFWLNLRQAYELKTAQKKLRGALRSLKPLRKRPNA